VGGRGWIEEERREEREYRYFKGNK